MSENSTCRVRLTSLSTTRRMFPMGALMHGGLERAADRFGDRVAIRAGDDAWTFADLDGLSNAFARHLAAQGVGHRDRIAVMLTNRFELTIVVHAASKLGAAAVMISPAWKAVEVAHAVGLTCPVHGVADAAGVAALGEHVGVTDLDEPGDAFAHDRAPIAVDIDETDESVLVFSSGTTGFPKAVRHTHRSMCHGTRHWVDVLGLTADD